jgi:hypothetical protein
MESSERRSFGSRQGEKIDAVQAPLDFRDDARGPKNQVQAIAEKKQVFHGFTLPPVVSFPP